MKTSTGKASGISLAAMLFGFRLARCFLLAAVSRFAKLGQVTTRYGQTYFWRGTAIGLDTSYDDMDLNTPIIAVGWFSGPHMASVAVVAWPLRWAARHPTAFASDSSCNTQLVRALLPLETDKWESNDEVCMKDVAFSGIHFPRCSLTLEISTNCVGVKCGHPDPDMDNSNDAACHTEQPFGYLALSLQYV